ncbi:MAG: T9SS type A sorting domain-containing protein, partial [Bacteroidota bacterium]
IQSPRLKSLELKSDKPGHELIQPGELGGIRYKAGNIGHNSAQDVEVRLRFLDSGAQLVSNESQMISEITPGQKPAFIFQVKISDSIALGTLIPVQITLTSENKVQLIDTLHIRIGRVPVMVIDLDPDKASAPLIWQTVKDLGYLADYKNLITSEMNEYQSVFISLGESSKRHILSYSEAMMLTDYLDQGGNIYLESRNIWRDDLLTSLQPRFNILTINKLHIYDTITASAGSFTEGMRFTGAHNLVSFYYIHPLWEAFSLFTDGDFTCSVANDAGTYKTIGCLFGFSAFLGINPASTQPNLMQKYLDFFQIKRNSVGINETATNALPGTVYVYPNPAIENAYLAFSLHETASVTATISDLTGRHIANIQAKNISPNVSCTLKWDLTDYSGQKVKPGLYSCRIVSAKEVLFGKIIVK